MRIGLRTIKTAVSATLAIFLAAGLGLQYTTAAGIIAVLSLTNTKRSSLFTGISRLLALTLATIVAGVCFTLFGYTTWAFGIYLLLYIPLTVRFGLADGIVVCSVLVTHYLIEESLSWPWIANEFALMIIGVGLALLMNLYMPNVEKKLKMNQEEIEAGFREILREMAKGISQQGSLTGIDEKYHELARFIRKAEEQAQNFQENQWFTPNFYYSDYFSMRRAQGKILAEMIDCLKKIQVAPQHGENMQFLLNYTAKTFAQNNDGQTILAMIAEVLDDYRMMALPQTRDEFEKRAELFQFLQSFKSFIEVKAEFAGKLEG